jgi:phosphatidylserine decarboxylase
LLKIVLVPINRAGWPFIGLFAAASVAMAYVAQPLGLIGAILTLWCVYFFRDPERVTPNRRRLIVSPADGVVQLVDAAVPPPELEMGNESRPRVAIFMNVFNVHVNRSPCNGTITKSVYRKGKFFNASLDKASELNERQCLRMAMSDQEGDIAFVQIAGLVARRILCHVAEGQVLRAGERFGLIRFGSRVDVYLPEGAAPLLAKGQISVAGETVIADLRSRDSAPDGEVH